MNGGLPHQLMEVEYKKLLEWQHIMSNLNTALGEVLVSLTTKFTGKAYRTAMPHVQ